MFRVLLINPPRVHLVRLDTPALVDLGEISSFPPVGLMYIAEALRQKNANFNVAIIDAVVEKLSYAQIVKRALEFSPDIIGLTAFSYTFFDVLHTAQEIKKAMPGVFVAVGGPHMYIFAAETMSHPCFDYGIVGDGEEVFSGLCAQLYEHRAPAGRPGLFFRQQGQVVGSGAACIDDLDALAIPALGLINPHAYYSTVGKARAVGTICTSRGCPFRCTFCQVPRRTYRMRSISNIIGEIQAYMEKGINDFFFFDDLFNITKKRVVDFCEEVLSSRLKIGWMFRGRIDQLDRACLRLARRAGCHTISIGVEDATDEGLAAIKKNINLAQAFEAVRAIRAQGIRCSTNWIIGFPSHRTLKDLEHLLAIALKMDADYAQFSILQCLPGSELYDQAVAEGGIDPGAWPGYVLNPSENFSPPIWEKHLTKPMLYEFYEYSYRRYYLRPKVMWRELLRIGSLAEAKNKLRSFRSIFSKNRQGGHGE